MTEFLSNKCVRQSDVFLTNSNHVKIVEASKLLLRYIITIMKDRD